MAKGYPSRRRARKAFERGVKDGQRRRFHIHPYQHLRLIDLYSRGLEVGAKMPATFPKRRRARALCDRSGEGRAEAKWSRDNFSRT